MRRILRLMFPTTEINLIVWLALLGLVLFNSTGVVKIKTMAIVGVLFAAVAQHWAYYAAYRRARQM